MKVKMLLTHHISHHPIGEASLMKKDIAVCSHSTVYREGPTLHLRLTLALCCPNFAIVLLNWT